MALDDILDFVGDILDDGLDMDKVKGKWCVDNVDGYTLEEIAEESDEDADDMDIIMNIHEDYVVTRTNSGDSMRWSVETFEDGFIMRNDEGDRWKVYYNEDDNSLSFKDEGQEFVMVPYDEVYDDDDDKDESLIDILLGDDEDEDEVSDDTMDILSENAETFIKLMNKVDEYDELPDELLDEMDALEEMADVIEDTDFDDLDEEEAADLANSLADYNEFLYQFF